MNRKFLLILTSILVLSGCNNQPASPTSSIPLERNKDIYSYPFKTARLNFDVTGSTVGKSVALVKEDSKKIENDLVQTRPDGTKNTIKNLIIQQGNKIYTLDPQTKTGNYLTNPLFEQLATLTPEQRNEKLLREALRVKEGDPIPSPKEEKQVAGQTCQVYESIGGTVCLWHNIPLESVIYLPEFGVDLKTVATTIELDTDLTDQDFQVPSDYKVTEFN